MFYSRSSFTLRWLFFLPTQKCPLEIYENCSYLIIDIDVSEIGSFKFRLNSVATSNYLSAKELFEELRWSVFFLIGVLEIVLKRLVTIIYVSIYVTIIVGINFITVAYIIESTNQERPELLLYGFNIIWLKKFQAKVKITYSLMNYTRGEKCKFGLNKYLSPFGWGFAKCLIPQTYPYRYPAQSVRKLIINFHALQLENDYQVSNIYIVTKTV